VSQIRSYCPGIGTNLQERDLIKFDERGTSGGRPVEKERMGIGWKDALREIKMNLQRRSDGGDSSEKFWKGNEE